MTIHTIGNYPDKFHPHLHAIVTDGLFNENGRNRKSAPHRPHRRYLTRVSSRSSPRVGGAPHTKQAPLFQGVPSAREGQNDGETETYCR